MIKYRGKSKHTLDWEHGGVFCSEKSHRVYILHSLSKYHEVMIDTVGQWTGYRDIDDTEVYSDDFIQNTEHPHLIYHVQMSGGAWVGVDAMGESDLDWLMSMAPFKVIGNVHDNPELLKAGDFGEVVNSVEELARRAT